MSQCASCKKELPAGASFCPSCGAKVAVRVEKNGSTGKAVFALMFSFIVVLAVVFGLSGKDSAAKQGRPSAVSTPQTSASGLNEVRLQRLAREEVGRVVKDPSSAQFRNQKGQCGEVNAKNSFGAYTGYTRFIAGSGVVALEGDQALTAQQFDDMWRKFCR